MKRAFLGDRGRIFPASEINAAVANALGLSPNALRSRSPGLIGSQRHAVCRPRMAAMWLMRKLTDMSMPEIGRFYSAMHHTSVLHGIRQVERARGQDGDLQALLDMVEEHLRLRGGRPAVPRSVARDWRLGTVPDAQALQGKAS